MLNCQGTKIPKFFNCEMSSSTRLVAWRSSPDKQAAAPPQAASQAKYGGSLAKPDLASLSPRQTSFLLIDFKIWV